jgi:hypothetical protein
MEREELEEHVQQCQQRYRVSELQLYGKRCEKVIELFYNPLNQLFYENKPENLKRATSSKHSQPIGPFLFIQNTKLGFYIERNGAIIEYFRDSYEGWYINKYVHGHQQMMTNSESIKFCQCRVGLNFNTASYEAALAASNAE